jgi:DNA replication protein DnaC
MTTTGLVRDEIDRFLRFEEPEVIAITGEWGVGKTYMLTKMEISFLSVQSLFHNAKISALQVSVSLDTMASS